MLREHDAPDCIIDALKYRDLSDEHYYLYGSGRALAFVRMAADALQALGNEQKIAEYHGYVGISAVRTAIDAAANWLRIRLNVTVRSPLLVDFTKADFLKALIAKQPSIRSYVECLGALAREIDPERQRVQHREGLALRYCTSERPNWEGWYLTKGMQTPWDENQQLHLVLRKWADDIELAVCGIISLLMPREGEV